jgi:EAL domain-containing protein (putative c-di-GMP-specific phosphodiesterase class I)
VDILKIDRSFLTGTAPGSPGKALLEAIVAMAGSLNLDVIPEGIEDHEQLKQLRAMGCQIGQGFLLSRPVPATSIDVLLAARLRPTRRSVSEAPANLSMSPATSPVLVA